MPKPLPFYRLGELIIAKYGEEKFDTGCELVAQWINAGRQEKVWHPNSIHVLCFMDSESEILTAHDAYKLCLFFGLADIRALYTSPKNTSKKLLRELKALKYKEFKKW